MIFMLAALAQPAPSAEVIIVRAERLKEPASSSLNVAGETLQSQPGVRLDEALRLVPGLGLFRRTSSGAANATIQGLSLRPIAPNGAGRALVSLDGVPQNDPFGGWIYWGRYDPVFLTKVDVKRGSLGAGFGPMALTGTLDLTEARGQPSAINLSLGGLSSVHGAARGSLATDGAMFTAMAAYDSSEGVYAIGPAQRGAVDRPIDFQFASLVLVTDIARDNGAWSFRGAGFSESKGAGLIGGQSSAQGLDISIARRFEGDFGQSRFLIYAQGRDFSNQTVAVTAGRAGSTPALNQHATPSSALGGSIALVPQADLNLPSLTVDWRRAQGQTREYFRFISNSFTRARLAGGQQDWLGLGLSLPRPLTLKSAGIRLDGLMRFDYWANNNGIRIETDRSTGTVLLQEAARDVDGSVVTGRVTASQMNGPLGVTIYRTFRPPTLNELHRPFRIGNDVTEANSALKPEILFGLDIDWRAKRPLGEGMVTTSLTLYANRLDDPIANVTLANGPGVFPRVGFLPAGGSVRERRNVGRVDATGFEANIDWAAGPRAPSASFALSATDARVDGGALLPQLTGNRPAQAPSWSAVARLSWPIVEKGRVSATLRGESARFEDDLNVRSLAAYTAMDMRVDWEIGLRARIFLSAENAFAASIPTALAGDGIVSLAQGRMFRLGVTIGQ